MTRDTRLSNLIQHQWEKYQYKSLCEYDEQVQSSPDHKKNFAARIFVFGYNMTVQVCFFMYFLTDTKSKYRKRTNADDF